MIFHTPKSARTKLTVASFAFVLMLLFNAGLLQAQLKAKVTVDPAQAKATVYTTSFGIAADRWDKKWYDPDTIKLLQEAGITNVRFPGNGGIEALYHWSTGKLTNPYTEDRLPAFPGEKMFPAMVSVIDTLGSGLVTVNYGTNMDGSGGGEPAEAAAWVAYANGNPANTQSIGKDSKGNDWKTVGFWAGLRASAPLGTDDGYNHLRINHPTPIGIPMWTIGNEPFNNGFYGQARTVGSDADNEGKLGQSPPPEPDLHAGPVPNSKEWGRHQGNSKVGPAAYGAAIVEFAKAMKAVDPSILIGGFVMQPPYSADADQRGKNWNAQMLKAACGSMDFAAAAFWEAKAAPPDWNWVDENDLITNARDPMNKDRNFTGVNAIEYDYRQLGNDLLDKYKKFCPSNRHPQLAVTSLGLPAWLPFKSSASVGGVFAAEAYAKLLERGTYTVEWVPVHGPVGASSPSFLDTDNKPQPAYYGIKFLHQMAEPGDSFINASTEAETLSVYATKRRNGGLGLLLINKDTMRSVVATVTVNGYNYASKGTRYDYGKTTDETGKSIHQAPVENLGATFTVEVPRYSMTEIVIPKAE
jgi:hypothetical protein